MTLPPIRRAVIVDAVPETAFTVFTNDFGSWWPMGGFSVYGGEGTVAMADGEIIEVSASGEHAHWGSVTTWEPPGRVGFTWHPASGDPDRSSRVEVTFTDLDGQTLVVLEHSGWEVYDDPATARTEYGHGWITVIAEYAGAISGE